LRGEQGDGAATEGGGRGDRAAVMRGALDRTYDDGRHSGTERRRRQAGWIEAAAMRGRLDQSSDEEKQVESERRQRVGSARGQRQGRAS
jgi:hypothetical protein